MNKTKLYFPLGERITSLGRLRALLVLSLIWLGPALACGSFAPRPSPTLTAIQNVPPTTVTGAEPNIELQPTTLEIPLPPTNTPPAPPTPTFTPTAQPGTILVVGQPARVTAPAGLNLRDAPSTGGRLLLQLGTGQRVTVQEGPVNADTYTWWRVDDGAGNIGWGADGDGATVWISPRVGEPQPVNRPPRVGERVAVTSQAGQQLTLRALPGTDGPLITRADPGREFTVTAGPQQANGYTWYRLRSDDGTLEAWAADGDATRRWISPLE